MNYINKALEIAKHYSSTRPDRPGMLNHEQLRATPIGTRIRLNYTRDDGTHHYDAATYLGLDANGFTFSMNCDGLPSHPHLSDFCLIQTGAGLWHPWNWLSLDEPTQPPAAFAQAQ